MANERNNSYDIHGENNAETVKNTEGLKIVLTKPADFDACADVSITTTDELSRAINRIFAGAFNDFYGIHLAVQNVPGRGLAISPILYFRVLPFSAYEDDSAYFAFNPIAKGGRGVSMLNRVERVSRYNSPLDKQVIITDDGKSALEDFMQVAPGKKFNDNQWQQVYSVIPVGENTFIQLQRVDLLKVVSKVFGEIDEEGTPYYYNVAPARPVSGFNGAYKAAENWILNIMRLHHGAEARAADLVGLQTPADANIPTMVVADPYINKRMR